MLVLAHQQDRQPREARGNARRSSPPEASAGAPLVRL